MHVIPHPTWIEVDLAQFQRNVAAIRKRIGKRLFCLPVKANGYGHGLVGIGRAAEAAGIDYLGVSCLQEGIELRRAGVQIPILIFGGIHEEQIPFCIEEALDVTVSSRFKAELIAKACEAVGRFCRIHVKVDTGMRRVGVRVESAEELIRFIKEQRLLDLVGIYSHFATAEEPEDPTAKAQLEQFLQLKEKVKMPCLWHMANSGGVVFYPESHLDMVRPGLLVYGYWPNEQRVEEVAPILTLKAKVSYFKVVPKGAGISYGHRYRTREVSRVATVPIGYGDGFRRAFSKGGSVLIRGKRYPIAGSICMDQFMVDLGSGEAYVGDEVVLIGKQGKEEISLWDLVRISDSIPHEVLTLFNERIPRRYIYSKSESMILT